MDGVPKDLGPSKLNIQDDGGPVDASSSTSPMGHRSAFSTLSKKFRESTIGQRLKGPAQNLSSSVSTPGPLAPPPDPSQVSIPTVGSWSLCPEVTTCQIGTKVSAESFGRPATGSVQHILTTMKSMFQKAHSDEDGDMMMVEYREGKAKRTEYCMSSFNIPEGVFEN